MQRIFFGSTKLRGNIVEAYIKIQDRSHEVGRGVGDAEAQLRNYFNLCSIFYTCEEGVKNMLIDESADSNREIQEKVVEGIRETLNLFEEKPEMFSTEGDCVAHLYRVIGNKRVNCRRLVDPHPKTNACAIRREWKRRGSKEGIDIVIIDSRTFKVREKDTKTGGGFGSAKNYVVIEVKGPQLDVEDIKKDIDKVSKLLDKPPFANEGFVVVFAGENIESWNELKQMADGKNVNFYHKETDRFS